MSDTMLLGILRMPNPCTTPLDTEQFISTARRAAKRIESDKETIDELSQIVREISDAWVYFSEYDVPIGIKERIDAALAKLENSNA